MKLIAIIMNPATQPVVGRVSYDNVIDRRTDEVVIRKGRYIGNNHVAVMLSLGIDRIRVMPE